MVDSGFRWEVHWQGCPGNRSSRFSTPRQASRQCNCGPLVFEEKANKAREDAIVKRMMKMSGTAVLVLGGAHDLSDNVPKGVKLIVLTVKGYPEE
jgi:hypothetical protein